MSIESEFFKKYVVDLKKAEEHGFKKDGGKHSFSVPFLNGSFNAAVEINENGEVSGIVYDAASGDEYIPLRVDGQKGAFIDSVRVAYDNILQDIRNNCFIKNNFIFPQTNRIAAAIKEKYDCEPEFLWEKWPNFGVFRHFYNKKWFGIVMNIDRSRLEKGKEGEIEAINLKLDRSDIEELLHHVGFYQSYHMNKRYWITLVLDDSVRDEFALNCIDASYNNTSK